MANINEAFNSNFDGNNINKMTNNDIIDHFFTQRKVTEYEEYIDKKNMERKKKKKELTYNFIAINIPNNLHANQEDVSIDIRVWGDEGFKYSGNIENKEGDFPSLLLKLSTDKKIFIDLKMIDKKKNVEDIEEKEYVTFVDIPKRYQIEPKLSS
tara:strand:- start:1208 stop:1669 length:462 start_codon:yes stop_codon:yes gene_type:complete